MTASAMGSASRLSQKIALTSQWSLTPQAQLAYSSVRFDSFTDQYGADVSLDDGDSLTGRLGISADYDGDWKDASGKINRVKLYGIANLYHDFLNGSDVDVSGTSLVSENQALWGAVLAWAARSVGRTTVMRSTAKPSPAPASRTSATASHRGEGRVQREMVGPATAPRRAASNRTMTSPRIRPLLLLIPRTRADRREADRRGAGFLRPGHEAPATRRNVPNARERARGR